MPFMITVPFKLSVWFVLYVSGLLKSSNCEYIIANFSFYVYVYLIYIFRCSTFGAYMLIIMAFSFVYPLMIV